MDVALLNVRITIQNNTVTTDEVGNHIPAWADYYSCAATVSGESGSETEVAGTTAEKTAVDFTVRYCRAVASIVPTEYRVLFNGAVYNILSMDHMNYKRKALKLRCRKESR